MKLTTWFTKGVAALALTLAGVNASAQIPVTDVASLTQQVQQVMSWGQQYKQMVDQYKRLKDQLDEQVKTVKSMNGVRGMGSIAQDMVRQQLPNDFAQIYDKIRSGGAGSASAAANAIYNAASPYKCKEAFPISPDDRRRCESNALAVPEHIALLDGSVKSSQDRMKKIQVLLNAVDTTTDIKAAADLQTRISSEMTYLHNEKMMMDLAVQQQQAQIALTQQANAAAGAKRMNTGSGSVNPFEK